MTNNQLETDILGLDLSYDGEKGILQWNIKNYIGETIRNYEKVISVERKNRKIPVHQIFIIIA